MCVLLISLGVCFFTKCVPVLVRDFKTSVSFVFTFSRLQCLLSLHFKTSMSFVFTFQDFNVFCLYISRLQCLLSLHFKTSMSSVFTFPRLQYLLSLHSNTSMSCVFTFQDFNVFCLYISRLQCLLFCCARLQCLLVRTFDTSFIYSFYRFRFLGFSLVVGRIARSLGWN